MGYHKFIVKYSVKYLFKYWNLENKAHVDIATPLILATMGILILVFFIILFVLLYQKKRLAHEAQLKEKENTYQRMLLDSSVEVAESERKRIASNIHDDIGMMLNVLKLNLSKINRNRNDNKLIDTVLNESNNILHETISSIRSISYDLIPSTLLKLGFIKGIEDLCIQINSSDIVQMNLRSNVVDANIGIKNELQLYRLIKEVLNNVIKHADAKNIELVIEKTNTNLVTIISHDGIGITTKEAVELEASTEGIGLKSIFSRIQLTSSTIEYTAGNEPRIFIQTPLI